MNENEIERQRKREVEARGRVNESPRWDSQIEMYEQRAIASLVTLARYHAQCHDEEWKGNIDLLLYEAIRFAGLVSLCAIQEPDIEGYLEAKMFAQDCAFKQAGQYLDEAINERRMK